uniref:Intraflagellar transport protein 172 homolog n=1 Tax=Clastoptera arizonana TaxID=38151 RepID=A0A1B6D0F4_9HEMI
MSKYAYLLKSQIYCSVRGTGFLSGHIDGTIVRYYVTEDNAMDQQGRVVNHPVPPFGLAWTTEHILAAGCDRRVTLYERDGRVHKHFDYNQEKEFTLACCSPSGQAIAVGSFDRIRVYAWSPRKGVWEEEPSKDINNLYTVTALAWKRDGSRVACGGLCGSVELFESVLRRSVWKNKFEMTYVGPSQVLVKPLNTDARGVILKSQFGHEIDDVRIMGSDRYLVARTPDTILLGDLHRNLLSEVPWPESGRNERFYFDNPNVCLIFNAGELSLVEYGNNEILGSVRTEFINPHLISVRLNERKQLNTPEDNKKLAYLLDLKTLCIVDLVFGVMLLTISHDSKIDWLELNETGHKLLFRDKKMRLSLLDTRTSQRHTILNYCTFVQWVIGSDVVVAQSRNNACVWYNIDTPDRVTTFPVRGEIIDVIRADGKSEILTQDGTHQLSYELDEGLVEFGTAIHDSDFGRAILFLENLPKGPGCPDADGMWQNLAEIALHLHNLRVAERCYAALGDISRTHFLQETIQIAEAYAKEYGGDGMDCPEVWVNMALLNKQFDTAEAIYLGQNQLEKALQMYQRFYKWDEALSLAEAKGYSGFQELCAKHLEWLIDTKQEDKAAEIKEKSKDYSAALSLYLKAGLPSRASRLVQNVPELLSNEEIVSRVIAALLKTEHYQQAGQMYEAIHEVDKALECYRKGCVFTKAVELARFISPKEVVVLEEQWGDYLTSNKQLDAAISHYIEAGKTVKALDAAVASRQWKKAVQIIQVIDDSSQVIKYYIQIGRHFASLKDYQLAERMFLEALLYKEAIQMYNDAGDWEKAHTLAERYLEPEQVTRMFVKQGQSLEQLGKLKEAEKLYVAVDQPDMAIAMYKANRQFDQMMSLVTQYHSDLVQTTHLHLAQQLESENQYKSAEQHYVAAGEWKLAVKMYRSMDMWEDAHRVAEQVGGQQSGNHVAFLWAKSLGGDSAVKLLSKFGLLETCIDYACDSYQFDFAFELAKTGVKSKLSDIHYKYALTLEDDGKFQLAEEHFVKAGKPKEAVLMYTHTQDWGNAERVATQCDEESLPQVLLGQAKDEFSKKNYSSFESLLLRAQKPELIVQHYQESGLWVDALRVCREYLPSKLATVQAEYEREVGARGTRDVSSIVNQARQWEQSGEFKAAVDCYLRINNNNCKDSSTILKALQEAARITNKYMEGEEGFKIAKILGPRLIEVKQHNLAAQTFLAVDMIKEAVDTFIISEEWSKAKKVAREFEPSLESYVDGKYKESLRKQGRADQLADVDIISALDLLCEQGQWKKCIETAKPHGPQVLHKYVALYATHLIKEGFVLKALNLYSKLEAPAYPQNYNIYRRISMDIIAMPGLSGEEGFPTWARLRNLLFGLIEAMSKTSDAGCETHFEFTTLMQICHYYAVRSASRNVKGLDTVATNISISLLRHTDIIPADKGFYEAGMDAKQTGRDSEAFVFLNHYLDIVEAIEEGNLEALDYSDFIATDFPQEIPLPSTTHVSSTEHEQIKEWVLSVSMDQNIDQVLPLDERRLYPSALVRFDSNGSSLPACIITGYPVLGSQRGHQVVHFKRPGCMANKEDLNKFMMATKIAPTNTALKDVIKFITNWCGPLPSYNFA